MKKVCTYLIIIILISNIIVYSSTSRSFATDNNQNQNTVEDTESQSNTDANTNTNTTGTTLTDKQEYLKQKIDESNLVLEYVQSELSTALIQVQKLNTNIETYQSQIEELDTKINDTQQELNQNREKLEDLEKSYNENYELLGQRIVALYEAGDTSYLDVLLQSNSIVEFISNYFLITQLAEYDSNLLDKIESEKNTVELTKKVLEEKEESMKQLKAKKQQTALVLENTKTMQEVYMAQLTDEEKKVQQEIEKYSNEQRQVEAQIQAALQTSTRYSYQYTGGQFIWPIAKEGTHVTSPFGNREHPIQGVVKLHSGLDIGGAGYGAPVVAAADGVVTYAGWMSGYGNCVMIKHSDSLVTLYGHGQTILTTVGKQVKQGDLIMEVGSTGNSTGPHLHFEVRLNGTAVDPTTYLSGTNNNQQSNTNTTDNQQQNTVDN